MTWYTENYPQIHPTKREKYLLPPKKSRILDDTAKKLSPHGMVLPRKYDIPKTHIGTCH
jgi:hypothetical protein